MISQDDVFEQVGKVAAFRSGWCTTVVRHPHNSELVLIGLSRELEIGMHVFCTVDSTVMVCDKNWNMPFYFDLSSELAETAWGSLLTSIWESEQLRLIKGKLPKEAA